MIHLIGFLAYIIMLIILLSSMVLSLATVIRYRKRLNHLENGAVIMTGVSSAFIGLLVTIRSIHIFMSYESFIAILMGISILIAIIFLAVNAYKKVFSRRQSYRRAFWIYIAVMLFLIAFTAFSIVMANLTR